jgi:hypothetical protein
MTGNMRWRKSTYSGGENNDCVELAHTFDAVRDSKNRCGSILRVARLTAFVAEAKSGRLDRSR